MIATLLGVTEPAFASPPTAELHVHIEGTIEPAAILRMMKRNSGAQISPEDFLARYKFADLQSFLDLHYSNLTVLRTEQDFYDLASAYLKRAEQANVRRAEIFFDPQTHLSNGIALDAVLGGLSAALADSPISTGLIMCFLRDRGAEAADEMLSAILPFRDQIIGVGLDSTEIGYPAQLFIDVYARAAAEGLHLVAHAGEEGGPDTVSDTLDLLHVQRIDHGIRAMEDPALVKRLVTERVPLTVCPLSNVALRAVDTLADHPLPSMLAQGVLATVNSDDPPYFGGYIDDNYRAVQAEFGFGPDEMATLALNSFDACFIDEPTREVWKAEVRAFYA
jgi:adenosine deaminase